MKRAMRFGDQEASAGANHAMPGDALSAGASGHGIANGARASREAQRTSEFAVRGDATARNFLDQPIDGLPGHLSCAPQKKEEFTADGQRPQRKSTTGSPVLEKAAERRAPTSGACVPYRRKSFSLGET